MEVTRNDNPIEFEAERQGNSVNIYLYPLKGKHKPKDIQRAKFWLRGAYGKAYGYVQVRWKLTDEPMTPLHRVPDEAIISRLQVELGKKESYIEELEEQLRKREQNKPTPDQIKEIHRDTLVTQQKQQITKLQKKEKQLRKDLRSVLDRLLECNGTIPKGINLDNDTSDPQPFED